MPTVRQRHMVTETDELAHALDEAASIWPESKGERATLLRLIIAEGVRTIESEAQSRKALKFQALDRYAGKFGGVWPEGWRQEVADEWPE